MGSAVFNKFLLLTLAFAIFILPVVLAAEDLPTTLMETTQDAKCLVEVHGVSQKDSGNLGIDFVVMNLTKEYLSNIRYTAVVQKRIDPSTLQKIITFEGKLDDLTSENALRFDLDENLPKSIDSDKYELFMMVYYSEDNVCGSDVFEEFSLNGTGGWIPSPKGVIKAGSVDMNFYDGTPVSGNPVAKVLLPFLMNPVLSQKNDLESYTLLAKVFSRNDSESLLAEFNNLTGKIITDPKYGESFEFEIPINQKNLDAGNYEVYVTMQKSGEKISAFNFRWIIDGLSLKIGNVVFNTTEVVANKSFSINLNLLIPSREVPSENVKVDAKIVGVNGDEINISKTVALNALVQNVVLEEVSSKSFAVKNLSVKASSASTGALLDEYSIEVPQLAAPSTGNQTSEASADQSMIIIIAAVIILVLILAVGFFVYTKKVKKK